MYSKNIQIFSELFAKLSFHHQMQTRNSILHSIESDIDFCGIINFYFFAQTNQDRL